ncbi:T-cell receptor-associated transmembrane adapter 1 isoform X2 [Talpa occidentalis]|uniref:T-cell receptor-associated transmembrane adapter 1 isoform X2 n=1 Tax=Talpa occidentalis TaxID=50954 RepID=UPI00188E430C|nr:T-cell receptor-associated transmembrane adapter 1 isoform X2 [Talpa occidentalis]
MAGNIECQPYIWAILAFLGLALTISLIFNISYYKEKHQKDKILAYANDYFPREDESYIEDTPIYGNLETVIPESMDENCYEQMKAQPERPVSELQEAPRPAQVTSEREMFYAPLGHNNEGKRRKPRKQNAFLSDKDENKQLPSKNASISQTTLVDNFPPEGQTEEENIHDDPIRLFGLIRAKKEPTN